MISCKECISRCFPDDPHIRSGRYMRCGCDYCDKPSYERELEARLDEPREVVHKHFYSDLSKQQWDRVEQSLRDNADLRKKVNELYEKRKGVEYEIKG